MRSLRVLTAVGAVGLVSASLFSSQVSADYRLCKGTSSHVADMVSQAVSADPASAQSFAENACQCSGDHQQAIGAGLAQASRVLISNGNVEAAGSVQGAACNACLGTPESSTTVGYATALGGTTGQVCKVAYQNIGGPAPSLFTINANGGGGGASNN